jgi:hypothetical protein
MKLASIGWRALLAGGVLLACAFGVHHIHGPRPPNLEANEHEGPGSLGQLLALPPDHLHVLDIARLNLLCAEGLPKAEDLDIDRALVQLDEMAARVRSETERHRYRFQKHPAEFEHSQGFFQMLMLTVVLAEDFGGVSAAVALMAVSRLALPPHHRLGARSTPPARPV